MCIFCKSNKLLFMIKICAYLVCFIPSMFGFASLSMRMCVVMCMGDGDGAIKGHVYVLTIPLSVVVVFVRRAKLTVIHRLSSTYLNIVGNVFFFKKYIRYSL